MSAEAKAAYVAGWVTAGLRPILDNGSAQLGLTPPRFEVLSANLQRLIFADGDVVEIRVEGVSP